MRVLIAGGKLQGAEAAYLADKCGFETVVIDKNDFVPAKNLCGRFIQMEISDRVQLSSLLEKTDIVIPALENHVALAELADACREADVPLIFPKNAYSISSSKQKSKALFGKLNIHTPNSWPDCDFPVIMKPSLGSGSEGVRIYHNEQDLLSYFTGKFSDSFFGSLTGDEMVIEEYIQGRQYSIEVIGFDGVYKCLQVTELEMDDIFDCKRVLAPSKLPYEAVAELEEISVSIARTLDLNGIMDVEVIYQNGRVKVLEIDARLPSQTPTAVFWSSGVNMVEKIVNTFMGKPADRVVPESRAVILEHLRYDRGILRTCGEHIMAETADLDIHPGFFGADEAISDYQSWKSSWSATIIVTGRTRTEARSKRKDVIKRITDQLAISDYRDASPELLRTMSGTGVL